MNRRDFLKAAAAAGFGVMTNIGCNWKQRDIITSTQKSTLLNSGQINWTLDPNNPVVRPGQLNSPFDVDHAGAAHVVQLGDIYRMYYWGVGVKDSNQISNKQRPEFYNNFICMAESSIEEPNNWKGLGYVLAPQPDTDHNYGGPSFPFVLALDEKNWLMYFVGWGKAREDGTLPNTTSLAVSEDGGISWHYYPGNPVLPLDKPWDKSATGSVSVVRVANEFRMYYTSIGQYFQKPQGVRTGHGDVIPRIGIGYAVSQNGIDWTKPFDSLLVEPRGFDADPYEYLVSKPCVIRDGKLWRMWVSTYGYAYRIRSLISNDGLNWTWLPSGPDGDLGIGRPDTFDDIQRSYATAIKYGSEYRLWYTGNGFGKTGMGYATGVLE